MAGDEFCEACGASAHSLSPREVEQTVTPLLARLAAAESEAARLRERVKLAETARAGRGGYEASDLLAAITRALAAEREAGRERYWATRRAALEDAADLAERNGETWTAREIRDLAAKAAPAPGAKGGSDGR